MLESTIRDDFKPVTGVARLVLNRPSVHNAFDENLIAELTAALRRLDGDPAVRAVVLAAEGDSFSAGADLAWMRRMADYSPQRNLDDARALAGLMRCLNEITKPTVARVQGAAFGGGVGLVACCDIAIASVRAVFSLSEVRLGLIPAVISPYVARAMGERQARRYFLTAERFDAQEALRVGLVHRVVEPAALDAAVDECVAHLLANGPAALKAAKELIRAVSQGPVDAAMIEDTARRIATIRAGAEAREGVGAFLEKRKPQWRRD